MRRNGVHIRDYFLKGKINSGITFGRSFAEAEACVAANLSYDKWRLTEEYPSWFKAEVVVWYENHNLVAMHQRAAEAAAVKK